MDTILKVYYSTSYDIKFAVSCGIDTNKHSYSFKVKGILLELLVDWNCDTSIIPTKEAQGLSEKWLECAVCTEPTENAVHCGKCQNILCESHLPQSQSARTDKPHHSNHKKMGSSNNSSLTWKCHFPSAERRFHVEICRLTKKSSVAKNMHNRVELKVCKTCHFLFPRQLES